MSIYLDSKSVVIVQGITGREGLYHASRMREYGTKVAGGVTPGKGGQTVDKFPVFDTVSEAKQQTGADVSIIFVPPPFAADAILEAADAGIALVACITEGIPVHDMLKAVASLPPGARLIGPNCPGLVSPGEALVGIMPGHVFSRGDVGVVSRSGTLTYEIVDLLTRAGIGQSTCVGIGGDPIIGTVFVDCLRAFEKDPATAAVVLVGEIGGTDEEDAASLLTRGEFSKPVVAFIGGRSAPEGKRMGHAGAIVSGSSGTAQAKVAAFERAGVKVADSPAHIPDLISKVLRPAPHP
ncbi:MAG: succinate--CoA ligase subunit alpha [Candidatus Eremiobacter antarcticus]|nr:succinate--CoA ligase subunit alpha [Candidatus Eremiobacteraeota bacterium]PZR60806.1 MAG: succinate--CoA ligase subunit alpha [Candidatus Eremiobacter sp. RRmetagenome_bin22]